MQNSTSGKSELSASNVVQEMTRVEVRRNIVVFICDQLRPDFLDAYGCTAVPTPNIDRMAAIGVVFEKAITQAPVCAPARAGMMTGRYMSDHRVWTNDVPFRDGVEYIAERMNDLGYETGAFGKLHHFPADDPKGFQYVRQMEENRLGERDGYLKWLRSRHPEVSSVFPVSTDGRFRYDEAEYYEHWITSEAIDFIESCAQGEGASSDSPSPKPFFAWISFQGPHTPLDPPTEVSGTVNTDDLPAPLVRSTDEVCEIHKYRECISVAPRGLEAVMAARTLYAELIVEIDRQIGRVLNRLDEMNLTKDTTFIFSADHGDLLGDFNLMEKGPFPYRGQLDIPLIVANHPKVPRGVRSSALTGNIDIPSTILDIAGATRGIGYSISLIRQIAPVDEGGYRREVVFAEAWDAAKIVSDERYRYCVYPFLGFAELYDKQTDPDETSNLVGRPEYESVEVRMLKHIIDFMVVAKGPDLVAWDFVPGQQEGLAKKLPDWKTMPDWRVAFPLTLHHKNTMEAAGLDWHYTDYAKDMKIFAHYGLYWEEESNTK